MAAISFLLLAGWSVGMAVEQPVAAAGEPPASVTTEQRGQAYAHLMRALVQVRRGEFGTAIDEINQALELVPDSPDLLTESAELLLNWTGRVSEAERLAREANRIDPEHLGALRFLADLGAARALGPERDPAARDEAIALFEKLVVAEEVEDRADMLRTLVQLRLQASDREGALEDVRRLVEERPGDLRATQTLAQLLLRSGREAEALEVLLNYVSSHPFQEELLAWAEQLASSLQAWDAVVSYLEAQAPSREQASVLNRFYGEALLRVGRMSDAAEVLERAGEARPHDVKIRKDLALAYRGIGRLADAAELFAELAVESPEYPLLQQLLAETLENQQDGQGALEAYGTALGALSGRDDVAPSYRDAIRQRMAALYLEDSLFDDARRVIEEMEAEESPLATQIACRLAIASESWDEARRLSRQLADQGEDGRAVLLEGEIAAGERKWSKARARFREAIDRLGPYVRVNIADVYREAARPEEGLLLLLEWRDGEPDLADARFHLGVFYYELDRFEESEKELREAFRLDPRHARALNFLGYSLAERSMRLDEALGMIERALEVDAWNGAYLDSLGWVYYQMGRFEEARKPLERAARELPKDPVVLEHLGDVYLSLGDAREALTAWNKALDASPENPEALLGKIHTAGEAARLAAGDGSH